MWAATREVFNTGAPSLGEHSLSVADIKFILEEHVPGLHFDLGARKEIWHPQQGQFQAIHYYHRHICSLDRDRTPMWPIWNTKEELTSVPLDYALRHDDFPVLDIPVGARGPVMREDAEALVMRPAFDDVLYVGWCEVLWQLTHAVPGVDPQWWGRTFNVPVDWFSELKMSPLSYTFDEARKKGWAGV